jgi:prepilin-type N-terminal cleavage/methylation domain-containing protein
MKRAFTLVELLVVIAILAALMAVGLPVMRHARERGAEAVCQSNMRQMVMILKTYTNDNDGLFPDPSYLYHSKKSLDPNQLTIYLMGCRWHDARIGPGSPLMREDKTLQGLLIRYVGDPKVLLCKTGTRVNREQGCSNVSPVTTYAHTTRTEKGHSYVIEAVGVPHKDIPVVPQYTYTMNGNLHRTLKTGSLVAGTRSNRLDERTLRYRQIRKETHVTRSPSEVFAFGEENSWPIKRLSRHAGFCGLSGRWPEGSMDSIEEEIHDPIVGEFEIPGAITLGSLDIGPSYRISGNPGEHYADRVSGSAVGDAFATYHRLRGGDPNTGHSYVSMLDGHVRPITATDQVRKGWWDPNLPESKLGPGGNLHLAWPLDVPPLGGWENQ